jgi:hypothetical protein
LHTSNASCNILYLYILVLNYFTNLISVVDKEMANVTVKKGTLFTDQNRLSDVRRVFGQLYGRYGYDLYTRDDILTEFAGAVPTPNGEDFDIDFIKLKSFISQKKADIGKICLGGVGPDYMAISLTDALQKDKFDMLAAMDQNKNITAFIIAQYGECRMNPTFWAVNLICAGETGAGSFFLSAVSLCAKKFHEDRGQANHKVVLELALSYVNSSGLLTYSRCGFVKDMSLYFGEDVCYASPKKGESAASYEARSQAIAEKVRCFCQNTLPMSLSLDEFTYDQLIGFMQKRSRAANEIADADETGMLRALQSSPTRGLNDSQLDRLKPASLRCQKDANVYLQLEKDHKDAIEKNKPLPELDKLDQLKREKLEETKKCFRNYSLYYEKVYNDPVGPRDPAIVEAEQRGLVIDVNAPRASRSRAPPARYSYAKSTSPRRVRDEEKAQEVIPSASARASRTPSRGRTSASRSRASRSGMMNRNIAVSHITNAFEKMERRSGRHLSPPRSLSPSYYGMHRKPSYKW